MLLLALTIAIITTVYARVRDVPELIDDAKESNIVPGGMEDGLTFKGSQTGPNSIKDSIHIEVSDFAKNSQVHHEDFDHLEEDSMSVG